MPSMEEGIAPAKWSIGPPAPGYFSFISRILMLVIVILMGHWVQAYLKGVSVHPTVLPGDANDTGGIFNWHPILMTLAFVVFMTEAVLAYQSPLLSGFTRSTRKKVHWLLHSLAGLCILLGLIAVFKSHSLKLPKPMPDLYSPHSYLGMFTLILASSQYLIGFCSYLWPTTSLANRIALGPVHRFLGISVWVLGLATMAAGIQEKVTFLQAFGNLSADDLYGGLIRLPATILIFLPLLALSTLYQFVPPAQSIPARNGVSQSLLARSSVEALA